MKKLYFNEIQEGQELPSLRIGPIGQMDLVRYAGASGDFNPIHNDVEFAKKAGLPGTIAHGMYIMALLGRVATNFFHPMQIRSYGVKFKAMTFPGETIICRGVVKKKKEENNEKLAIVVLEALNEAGELKVSGELVVNLL